MRWWKKYNFEVVFVFLAVLLIWGVMLGVVGGICDPTPSPDSAWPPCAPGIRP